MDPAHLSPNFIIPVGTQVVLKKDHEVMGPAVGPDGGQLYKKLGSVGVVIEAPLTNDYAYVIRFSDGEVVRAKKNDLSVRRADAPEDDMPVREIALYERYVIYRVCMGSRAFGLDDESSDYDERGVYLPPAEWHWSLQPLPEQIEFKKSSSGRILDHNSPERADDFCWWEIQKFLRLALKANPNVLEALYAGDEHVLFCDEMGTKLRNLRGAFLSKYLYQTYSGYVLSQFKKLKRSVESGGTYRAKHASHLIRLLYSGIEAVKGNGILVDAGSHRAELMEIKRGGVPFDEIYKRALELNTRFQDEYARTKLPDRPDIAAVEQFLIAARKSRV